MGDRDGERGREITGDGGGGEGKEEGGRNWADIAIIYARSLNQRKQNRTITTSMAALNKEG